MTARPSFAFFASFAPRLRRRARAESTGLGAAKEAKKGPAQTGAVYSSRPRPVERLLTSPWGPAGVADAPAVGGRGSRRQPARGLLRPAGPAGGVPAPDAPGLALPADGRPVGGQPLLPEINPSPEHVPRSITHDPDDE